MKDEKRDQMKAANKAKEQLRNTADGKRIDFIVTYEVEGSRSKKQKVHAYSKEEAEEILSAKLGAQVSGGEINSYKILSIEKEN